MSRQTFSSNGFTVTFEDDSGEVLAALKNAVERGLEAIGSKAAGHAQEELRKPKQVTPGRTQDAVKSSGLLESMTNGYKVVGDDVYIGTNSEPAPYVEFGTGKYSTKGGGRVGWWVYVPGSTKKGDNSMKTYTYEEAKRIVAIMRSEGIDAHMTEGQMARPFLKPAASEHTEEYRDLLRESLKNA